MNPFCLNSSMVCAFIQSHIQNFLSDVVRSWRPASASTTSAPQTRPALSYGWTRSKAASPTRELPTSVRVEVRAGRWERRRKRRSTRLADVLNLGTTENKVPGSGGWILSMHLSACCSAAGHAVVTLLQLESDTFVSAVSSPLRTSNGDEVMMSWR